uniref:Uncharacterized protein n=1 Tax=Biomphalaria glabrata TaxID=6526 RepID=A0A2C9LBB5_BIOGL
MFVIDIQKEMVKGIKPVEQKIKYFYASGLLNEQLQKSLTEQLCLPSVNESLMSPTINIPRHPLALIAQNNSSSLVPYSEHRPSIVSLHYELLLDDHYTAKTKCQFDCSSEEAVMSVITCLEASSSETVVEVFFIKKDNQVSFVRYVFHELKTKDLKQLNFNLSHTSLAGEKTFQKHFLLPRTMYTRNIKMALAFPLNNPNDMEPKVVYIYLKDVKNLQDTAEECSPESSNSDHERSNSTQFNQQNEIHKENSAVGEHCQDNFEYKAKETKLPLHSPKEVKPTSQDHFSFNFLIEKPNDSSSTEPETMSDLKKMGETLCKTIIKTMKENFNLDLFNISTMGSTTTTKQIVDPKVTVNMFQINNNFSCSIDKVKNAVVGGGNLYCSMVSENSCSNSHPAMDQ